MRSKAEELASELGPAIKAQDGCRGVTFFGDDSDGEYGLSVLWESKENAEAAAAVISPKAAAGPRGQCPRAAFHPAVRGHL
jgi:hypothetical protein